MATRSFHLDLEKALFVPWGFSMAPRPETTIATEASHQSSRLDTEHACATVFTLTTSLKS